MKSTQEFRTENFKKFSQNVIKSLINHLKSYFMKLSNLFGSPQDSEIGNDMEIKYLYGHCKSRSEWIEMKCKWIYQYILEPRVRVGHHCGLLDVDDPLLKGIESEVKAYFESRNFYFKVIDIDIPNVGVKSHWYISILTGSDMKAYNKEKSNKDAK